MTVATIESRVRIVAPVLLRFALAAGLLSAVADRMGLWGPLGSPSVAWGNMSSFVTYTGHLAPWCPLVLVPALAWAVTAAESVLGLLLLTGASQRLVALCTFLLTLSFAVSMTVVLGAHAPLNYSVFVFAFAAMLLGLPQQEMPHE